MKKVFDKNTPCTWTVLPPITSPVEDDISEEYANVVLELIRKEHDEAYRGRWPSSS